MVETNLLEVYTMKPTNQTLPLPHVDTHMTPGEGDLAQMADLLRVYAPHDGKFGLRLPGAYANRWSKTDKELVHGVQPPTLCVVAQGAKSALLGPEVYEYNPSRMVVFAVDLPVSFQVTQASPEEPFLCLSLDLDPHRIAELALKDHPSVSRMREESGVYVGDARAGIVRAATRLLTLMADPWEAEHIGPLVVEEILIRLLHSSVGSRVARIGQAESGVHRVARAVDWLRRNYDQPLSVEELAGLAHMSLSTFHHHFKAVTSMSPLQFQKVLRLQEARRLMLASRVDATTAGRKVGYASASQFSREYSRLFGDAPSKDIAKLRG